MFFLLLHFYPTAQEQTVGYHAGPRTFSVYSSIIMTIVARSGLSCAVCLRSSWMRGLAAEAEHDCCRRCCPAQLSYECLDV